MAIPGIPPAVPGVYPGPYAYSLSPRRSSGKKGKNKKRVGVINGQRSSKKNTQKTQLEARQENLMMQVQSICVSDPMKDYMMWQNSNMQSMLMQQLLNKGENGGGRSSSFEIGDLLRVRIN
jgi:hypothetical protein